MAPSALPTITTSATITDALSNLQRRIMDILRTVQLVPVRRLTCRDFLTTTMRSRSIHAIENLAFLEHLMTLPNRFNIMDVREASPGLHLQDRIRILDLFTAKATWTTITPPQYTRRAYRESLLAFNKIIPTSAMSISPTVPTPISPTTNTEGRPTLPFTSSIITITEQVLSLVSLHQQPRYRYTLKLHHRIRLRCRRTSRIRFQPRQSTS